MKALLFDRVPENVVELKAHHRGASIFGSMVHGFESAKAILEHGTYDRYYFLERVPGLSGVPQQDLLPPWAVGRGQIVHADSMEAVQSINHVIMVTNEPVPHALIPYRSFPTCPGWPAVGFIHSLKGVNSQYVVLGALMSQLNDGDALICSSTAGQQIVQALSSSFLRSYPDLVERPSFQLPVIPLGVDCGHYENGDRTESRRRLGLPLDCLALLYFGRFSPVSKCDLGPLIMAFARWLETQNGKVMLVLAGDDTQHGIAESMRQYCGLLGCGGRVVIHPNCTWQERKDLFAAADIFVSPSDNIQETFGLALVEAMAAGLPVLASNWSGYREIVKHGITGFLVPTSWPEFGSEVDLVNTSPSFDILASSTGVDCEQLMHYATLLVRNPELRQSMGERARSDARERFDYPQIVRRWEELFDDLKARATNRRQAALSGGGCIEYPQLRTQSIFTGFPTQTLSDDQEIRLTETGKWWISTSLPLALNGPVPLFALDRLRDVASMAAKGGQSVGTLVRDIKQAGESDLMARACIGRLIKYGIVSLSPTYHSAALQNERHPVGVNYSHKEH